MPEAPNQAEFIASRFGGRSNLAAALDVPKWRVDDWCRRRKFIPQDKHMPILRAAAKLGVDVTPFDFIRHLVRLAEAA